ncbi:hypothetical protein Pd630_LPD15044 (plasmid) [Rhodococcus opacus PD630]|nr:hypothetical protein Pd630_LPD15044 [Rhodococcus opacus PD630]
MDRPAIETVRILDIDGMNSSITPLPTPTPRPRPRAARSRENRWRDNARMNRQATAGCPAI